LIGGEGGEEARGLGREGGREGGREQRVRWGEKKEGNIGGKKGGREGGREAYLFVLGLLDQLSEELPHLAFLAGEGADAAGRGREGGREGGRED